MNTFPLVARFPPLIAPPGPTVEDMQITYILLVDTMITHHPLHHCQPSPNHNHRSEFPKFFPSFHVLISSLLTHLSHACSHTTKRVLSPSQLESHTRAISILICMPQVPQTSAPVLLNLHLLLTAHIDLPASVPVSCYFSCPDLCCVSLMPLFLSGQSHHCCG